ncbi:MAG TPA: hypothetical protein VMW26_00620 [Methanomassiliicoccales archaeon]|nr:hypothetical protein [Methanomassiliicoccales archaeon]
MDKGELVRSRTGFSPIYGVLIVIGIILLVAGLWLLFTGTAYAGIIVLGIGIVVIGIGGIGFMGAASVKILVPVGILLIAVGLLIEYII